MLTAQQATLVNRDRIEWFLASDLGQLLRTHSAHIRREVPLCFMQHQDGPAALDCTMVRGRIDLLLITDDLLIIADYKTDRVTGSDLDVRSDFYSLQLAMYRSAMETILQRKATHTSLVFLHPKQIREVR